MSDENQERPDLGDIKVDAANLYKEEAITDLKVATIRRLIPIKADGTPDSSRKPIYSGETQVLTQAGPMPIQAKLEAESLEEAIQVFPVAIQGAVDRLIEEAREMRRQEQSRIVVPGTGGLPGAGGMPGGGRIELG